MEGRLKALFDYQKFEGDPALGKVIQETDARTGGMGIRALSDDDLELVSAGVERNVPGGGKKSIVIQCPACSSTGPFSIISGGRLKCSCGKIFNEEEAKRAGSDKTVN